MILNFKKLDKNAIAPSKAHATDAGFDLFSLETAEIGDGKTVKFKTGIALAIPDGYFGLICDRSSMGAKGLKVHGGVIDSSYRGEIIVCLHNSNSIDIVSAEGFVVESHPRKILKGDKIAQLVILPVPEVTLREVRGLAVTERGEDGFGSTGR